LWALSLDGTPSWQSIPTTGAPSIRNGHGAIYDAANDRMVVHGSNPVDGPRNETYALPFSGPAQWSVLPPCTLGPSSYCYNMAYVPEPVLFANGNETYALDLVQNPAWAFSARHIMARPAAAAGLAPDTRTMVVFGGSNGNINFGDAWTLDLSDQLASWRRLNPASAPLPAWKGPMVWDPLRARFLAFATHPVSGIAGLWALTLEPTPAWTEVQTGGMPPLWEGWRGVYDPSGDRLVFLAFERIDMGNGVFAFQNNVFLLPLSGPNALQWSQHDIFPSPFRGRLGASFSYDAGRDAAWIFGGADSADVALGDVWRVELTGTPSAAPVATIGGGPDPRSDHAAWFDNARDRLLSFRGA